MDEPGYSSSRRERFVFEDLETFTFSFSHTEYPSYTIHTFKLPLFTQTQRIVGVYALRVTRFLFGSSTVVMPASLLAEAAARIFRMRFSTRTEITDV